MSQRAPELPCSAPAIVRPALFGRFGHGEPGSAMGSRRRPGPASDRARVRGARGGPVLSRHVSPVQSSATFAPQLKGLAALGRRSVLAYAALHVESRAGTRRPGFCQRPGFRERGQILKKIVIRPKFEEGQNLEKSVTNLQALRFTLSCPIRTCVSSGGFPWFRLH